MQAYPPPTHVNHLNARCKDARMQDYRLQSPPYPYGHSKTTHSSLLACRSALPLSPSVATRAEGMQEFWLRKKKEWGLHQESAAPDIIKDRLAKSFKFRGSGSS